MKTKVLPLAWYLTAYTTFICGFLIATKVIGANAFVAVASAWLTSLLAAFILCRTLLKVKPDLIYTSEDKVDGMGYTHQWVHWVIQFTIVAVLSAISLGILLLVTHKSTFP